MTSRMVSTQKAVSRSVEEPIEASFELGEEFKALSTGLRRPLILALAGLLILALYLIPGTIDLANTVRDVMANETELTTHMMTRIVSATVATVIVGAIVTAAALFLFQVRTFNNHLLSRYELVEGMKNGGLAPKKGRTRSGMPGMHRKNPIYAMMDLVEAQMSVLPNVRKTLHMGIMLLGGLVGYLCLGGAAHLIFDESITFTAGYVELVLGTISLVLFVLALLPLMDTERALGRLWVRHGVIEGIRFGGNLNVPPGKDPLQRLIAYLTGTDPYVHFAMTRQKKRFEKNVRFRGVSGRPHRFDAYLEGETDLPALNLDLGIPPGRFGVFIRIYSDGPSRQEITELQTQIEDICQAREIYPIRTVALQNKIADLDEEVYDYLVEEGDISFRGGLSPVQVAAEDGPIYSFIPMVSYGRSSDHPVPSHSGLAVRPKENHWGGAAPK